VSAITTCPRCHGRLRIREGMSERTLLCPRCFDVLDNPRAGVGSSPSAINTDIRRDTTGMVVGLCCLGVLVVLGVITFFRVSGAELLRDTTQGATIVLSFIVLAAVLACLLVAGRRTTAKTILSTLGMVALAGLLVVFTVCAGVMAFFQSCKGMLGH
jgi:hypothetical protein